MLIYDLQLAHEIQRQLIKKCHINPNQCRVTVNVAFNSLGKIVITLEPVFSPLSWTGIKWNTHTRNNPANVLR